MDVMILDDETLARELIKYCVPWERLHLTLVYEGANAREALRFLEERSVDIILTDITMPDMDGLAFAREVRKRWPKIEVIVITGYDEFEYARQGIRVGAADFILKPVDDAELQKALEKIIYKKARTKAEVEDNAIPRESGIIGKAVSYMEENYGDAELGLGKLAEELHLNASYLSRIFKQQAGVTFSECLFEIRMKKALQELEKGDVMIYELAEKVGFTDADYFGRCFRKYTGMSFSQYKRKRKEP